MVSPCKRFIVAAVGRQINIFEIRKGNNLVLFKNLADLKTWNIIKLACYEGNSPKICFVDERGVTGVALLDVGMILTKVKIEKISHRLTRVDSIDAMRVNARDALMAVGGAGCFQVLSV